MPPTIGPRSPVIPTATVPPRATSDGNQGGFFHNLGQVAQGALRAAAEPALMVRDMAVLSYDVATGSNHELVSGMGRYSESEMSKGRSAGSVSGELLATTAVRTGAAMATGGGSEIAIASGSIVKAGYDAYEGKVTKDQALQSVGANLWALGTAAAPRAAARTPAAPTPTPRPASSSPKSQLGPAVSEAIEAAVGTPKPLAAVRPKVGEMMGEVKGVDASVARLGSRAGDCVQVSRVIPGQGAHGALPGTGPANVPVIAGARLGASPVNPLMAGHNWVKLPGGLRADPSLHNNLAITPPSAGRFGPLVNPGARQSIPGQRYFTPQEHAPLATQLRTGTKAARPGGDQRPGFVDARSVDPATLAAFFAQQNGAK